MSWSGCMKVRGIRILAILLPRWWCLWLLTGWLCLVLSVLTPLVIVVLIIVGGSSPLLLFSISRWNVFMLMIS